MRRSSFRLAALLATPLAALPPFALHAQRSSTIEVRTRRDGTVECYRDGRRVSCESLRTTVRATQVRHRGEDLRPRASLGGGADIRRFDDVNRYLGQLGVDFHTRFGLGLRPEVMYAWTDWQRERLPTIVCPSCATAPPNQATFEVKSRSQMIGVNLNATYTLLRGSPVRPYLLGGIGVFSTHETTPMVTSSVQLPGNPAITQLVYGTQKRDRTDVGLNAGAGLEFGRGPVRPFVEFRYYLNDTTSPRGFSGMLPITAGLRF